jgi:flagellar biosynthesis/type III secretory pathway M-ring protein FliF/YscJ
MMSHRGTNDTDPGFRSLWRLVVGLAVVAVVAVGIYVFFWSGVFKWQPEEETFWNLLHQKGHWYLEVFISGVETILFDILFGLIGWRYVLKPYIAQRQAQAVAQDHALHGIEAHTNDVEESGKQPVTERRGA